MRVYYFTEQPYPDAWNDHQGTLRVTLPMGGSIPRSRPTCSTATMMSG